MVSAGARLVADVRFVSRGRRARAADATLTSGSWPPRAAAGAGASSIRHPVPVQTARRPFLPPGHRPSAACLVCAGGELGWGGLYGTLTGR